MTELEMLQGIFVLQFLHMLITLGMFLIFAYGESKKEEKRSNEQLEEKIKRIVKDEKDGV